MNIDSEVFSVQLEFTEPIVALQDQDWNLPEGVY
jgi:hypothetical protein